MKKFARTISGVTPVAVMTLPMPCPGECVYCPTFTDTPQSYTTESPAVLRAKRCGYDAKKQVRLRLRVLSEMGHPTDKVELIVMGGTFLASPKDYQYQFIKDCFDALNGEESATLEEAKQLNQMAKHRCTGLCLETRPDWCQQEEIDRMLEFGTTRVELGVQTLDDEIYRLVRRGHKVDDVVKATALLREHGFKVHYHWMPGLPGSTPEEDLELSTRLFSDDSFKPDGLKLYPTMVVVGTELEKWYRDGRYQPYDVNTMVNLLVEIKSIVPRYVRISRVLRDIPSKFIVAGCRDSLRGEIKQRMKRRAIECKCIRCREYGHRAQDGWEIGSPHLVRMDYEASGSKEIFLSFEDENETLFGLLRMRIQSKPIPALGQKSNGNLALIRELHIFGPEVPLSQQNPAATQHNRLFSKGIKRGEEGELKRGEASLIQLLPPPFIREGDKGGRLPNKNLKGEGLVNNLQHKGLGKALLREAERIASDEFQAQLMVVLSGTGAKQYYRSEFGYSSQGDYMVKNLEAHISKVNLHPSQSASAWHPQCQSGGLSHA